MDNLIEMLGKQVTPGVLGQLSGMMGESEEATGNAVKAALPSLMGAMVNKGSTESGAEELLGLMNNMPGDIDVTADLGGLLGDKGSSSKLAEMGGPMVSGLLGDKAGGMLDMISSMAGIKKEGASSMMGMLAPMAIGMVKKQLGMGGGGMNASGLMSMLGGQSKFVEAAMPAGLSGVIGGISGIGNLGANLSGPDVDIKGPNVDLSGPDVDIKGPNVDLNAPDVDIKGPNVDLNAPDIDIKGPNVDLNAPDVDIKGPNVDLNAPDVDIKGPNVDLDGPDVDVNLKGADVDVSGPNVDIDKPSGGGIMRWLLPLLILLALLAGLLWYLLPGMRGGDMNANLDAGKVAVEGAVEAGADAVEGAVEAGADAVEGAVEAGKDAVEGAVEAGGAAVEGAVEAGSEAICSGMGSINDALGGLPEINADTDAGVVGESFGVIKTAYDAIIEAIGDSEIPGMDVLTSAFEGLDGAVSGLPASGAIGDAFEKVQEAFTSFTDSSKEFTAGFTCE